MEGVQGPDPVGNDAERGAYYVLKAIPNLKKASARARGWGGVGGKLVVLREEGLLLHLANRKALAAKFYLTVYSTGSAPWPETDSFRPNESAT